jgi:hypothetical protein
MNASNRKDTSHVDVFVYGATVGGIAAAISAARCVRRVILAERSGHIGAMTASGLGAIDVLRPNAVGGIFREFVDRTRAHYVETYGRDSDQYLLTYGGLFMEPHVAERILNEMLAAESGIRLLTHHELVKARTETNRVVGVELKNRLTGEHVEIDFTVAVDGAYEGDLAAAAGVSYRVGREGRSEFGERFAGRIFHDWRFNRQEFLPESTGESSEYVQAYCFRMTLCDEPKVRIPIEKPENYNEFLPIYRRLHEDFENGRVRFLRDILWLNPLANRKYCVNGHIEALTSINLAERNLDWSDGDYETRDRIYAEYRDYSLGLWYFLQNDPGVPLVMRTEVGPFGLCPDEYADIGHFPWQLYVRESRRIVGEHVITEHDSVPPSGRTRPPIHRDAVATYEHSFDCHPCRQRDSDGVATTPDGFEVLEGTIHFRNRLKAINKPATLPYRALVPEKIEGLLVPLAVSATHVAFSAVRMEPIFMASGQAAGIAASLAIEARCQVRQIDVSRLQRILADQGQVLVHFDDLDLNDPDFSALQLAAVENDPDGYDLPRIRREL